MMMTMAMTNRNNRARVYDPFREMENFFAPFRAMEDRVRAFRTDIRETEDAYELDAELPGFAKEDIALDLQDDVLTIHAEKNECRDNGENGQNEPDEAKYRYLCRERTVCAYERRFDLFGVDQDAIRAKYENGILHLTMPKSKPVQPETKHLTIE